MSDKKKQKNKHHSEQSSLNDEVSSSASDTSDSIASKVTAKASEYCHQADSPSLHRYFLLLANLQFSDTDTDTTPTIKSTIKSEIELYTQLDEDGQKSLPDPNQLLNSFLNSTIKSNNKNIDVEEKEFSSNFTKPTLPPNFKELLNGLSAETIEAGTDETKAFKRAVMKFLRSILPSDLNPTEEITKDVEKELKKAKSKLTAKLNGVADHLKSEPASSNSAKKSSPDVETKGGNNDIALFANNPNTIENITSNYVEMPRLSIIELKAHIDDNWKAGGTKKVSDTHLNNDLGQIGKYHFNDSTREPEDGSLLPFRFSLLFTTRDILLLGYYYPSNRYRIRWCVIDTVLNWKNTPYPNPNKGLSKKSLKRNRLDEKEVEDGNKDADDEDPKPMDLEGGKQPKPNYDGMKRLLSKWIIGMRLTKATSPATTTTTTTTTTTAPPPPPTTTTTTAPPPPTTTTTAPPPTTTATATATAPPPPPPTTATTTTPQQKQLLAYNGCFITTFKHKGKTYSAKRIDYSQRPFKIKEENKRKPNAIIASIAHPYDAFYVITIKYNSGKCKAEYLISPWREGHTTEYYRLPEWVIQPDGSFTEVEGDPYDTSLSQFVPPSIGVFDTIYEQIQRLHKAGFVHGDIRPYNIIWGLKQGWIIDFDLSGGEGDSYPDNYNLGKESDYRFPRPRDMKQRYRKGDKEMLQEDDMKAFGRLRGLAINTNEWVARVIEPLPWDELLLERSKHVATSSPPRDKLESNLPALKLTENEPEKPIASTSGVTDSAPKTEEHKKRLWFTSK